MKLGIVGLPNVGKSTLFNSITKAGAECANYPFCTIEPNVGVVAVSYTHLDVYKRQTQIVNLIIQVNVVILRCFRRFYHLEGGVLKLIVLFLKN